MQVARAADKLYLQGNENIRAGLKLFDDELPHIRAGQAWAAANMERDDDAARACDNYPLQYAGAALLSLRWNRRRAIEFYEQHLAIVREIGDRRGEGNALANLGLAYKTLGEVGRAKELWRAALAIYETIEDPNAERVRGWLGEG